MSRRVWIGLITLVCLALVVAVYVRMHFFEPGVTRANLSRVKPGMTREQVEAILGVPEMISGPVHRYRSAGWDGRNLAIFVSFDEEGHAIEAREVSAVTELFGEEAGQ